MQDYLRTSAGGVDELIRTRLMSEAQVQPDKPRSSPLASTISGEQMWTRAQQLTAYACDEHQGLVNAGLAVGSFVSVLVQPLDVIRTRIQADAAKKVAAASWHTTKSIYGEHGLRSDSALLTQLQPAGMTMGLRVLMQGILARHRPHPLALDIWTEPAVLRARDSERAGVDLETDSQATRSR